MRANRCSPVARYASRYGAGQQRVVVEHLLEVRHEPALIDAVAGEAAGEVVVDAAGGHLVERERDHVQQSSAAARRFQSRRSSCRSMLCGNLGAEPKPPCARIERPRERAGGVVEESTARWPGDTDPRRRHLLPREHRDARRRLRLSRLLQVAGQFVGLLHQPFRGGSARHRRRPTSTCSKPGIPIRGVGRPIGAAEKRLAGRASETPTSASRRGRSSSARRSCKSGRDRAAPRDRP